MALGKCFFCLLLNCLRYRTAISISLLFITNYGVCQHAGYFVRHYTSENGLPQNSVKGLKIDLKGYVWLATEAGLVRFDGTNFKLYKHTDPGHLQSQRVGSIHLTAEDTIFIREESGAYYKVNRRNLLEKYSPGSRELAEIRRSSSLYLYKLYNGCKLKVEKNKSLSWIVPDRRLLTAISANSLVALEGRYYYFNGNRELISADTGLSDFKKVKLSGFAEGKSLDFSNISVSFLPQKGKFFLRWGEYIYETHFSGDRSFLYGDTLLWIGNIPKVTTFAVYKEMHLFFIGSQTDGLYIFERQLFSTKTFRDRERNIFYAQAPFGRNGVLTEKGVLPEGTGKDLDGYLYISMLKTANGHYLMNRWLGNNNAGIVELDSNLNELHYTREFGLRVRSMLQLKDGAVLVSAENKFLGKLQDGALRWFKPPPALDEFTVYTVQEFAEDEFWIGGPKGLARFNLRTSEYRIFSEFSGLAVRSLYYDSKGVLWIGTYGGGYYAYYKEKAIKMPVDRNNYLLNVHTFLADQDGYCWMTTNKGLFQAKVSEMYDYIDGKLTFLYYQYYDRNSGFLTNEFNGGCFPSGIKLNNGYFSLPSINGIVQFDPGRIEPVFSSNSIFIDAVNADSSALDFTGDRISIPSNAGYIEISVSSPFFGTPYNHAIFYQINGLDSSWRELPADGIITLNRLEKGDYELVIKKLYGFGNRQKELRMVLTVEPAFYETWIFRILIVLLALSLLYFVFGLRVRMLKRQRARLEQEVEERTLNQHLLIEDLETAVSELEDSKEELYQNNIFLERLAMIITHDLQSPLRFLSDASRRISEKAHENELLEIENLSSEVQKSSITVHRFIVDFGIWIKSFEKNFRVKNESFKIADPLDELQQFFSEQLRAKTNVLIIEADKSLTINTDKQILLIILRNLIDNANKYTEHAKIEIKARDKGGMTTISIEDSGEGIPPEVLANIRALIRQKTPMVVKEDKIGLGYRFIKDFCRTLNITIEIETGKEKGTCIQLSNLKTV
jgi:signal transduction histidine kinase/ligand-binding sensor domain-containing protein